MKVCFEDLTDPKRGHAVAEKLRLAEMSDAELYQLQRYLWGRDDVMVERACAAFENKTYGKMELLRFYHWTFINRHLGGGRRRACP